MVLPENDHATSFHMKTRQVLIPVSVSPSVTLEFTVFGNIPGKGKFFYETRRKNIKYHGG